MVTLKHKKILFASLFFFLMVQIGFAYSYHDYELYTEAKNLYQQQKYEEAKEKFLFLKQVFPSSQVHREKLADFYLGLTYSHLGETEKAIPLLVKSVIPKYEQERNFTLSKLYLEKGDTKNALIYLDRLLSSQYNPELLQVEKNIKELLSSLDEYYQNYFQVKFEKNYQSLSKLKTSDVLEMIHFFSSKGEETESQKLILYFLEEHRDEEPFPLYAKLLTSFLKTKQYDSVLQYSNTFLQTDPHSKDNSDFYLLQKARAYFHKKDYLNSIFCYREIRDARYIPEATSELASIEYSLENYPKVLELLEKKRFKTNQDWKLLGNSYFALGKQEEFLWVAKKLQEKDPSAYENIFYQFLINYPDIAFQEFNSLLFINIIVDSYVNNLYPFDLQNWNKSNSLEYDKFMSLEKFQDIDLIQLEVKNSQFYNVSTLENAYFLSSFYEKFGFYELAFENSLKHISEFGRYRNLIHFLFPRYYQEIIQKYSFSYSIPEEILNTLILIASQWNSNYTKENRLGLFAMEQTEKNKASDLKNPETSIRIACEKIKELQKKYPKELPLMIAFLYGEEYLREIPFEENGDIFLTNIIDLQMKQELQNLMLYYSFYKKLYHF